MNEKELKEKYGLRKPNAVVLFIQMLLTIGGTVLAVVMLIQTLSSTPSALGLMMDIVYLLAHLGFILYAVRNHKREGEVYFQGVIYAFAAVIGIQILQNGMFIQDFGLSPTASMFINIVDIIVFGNAIKFADSLDHKKAALCYIGIATVLKLGAELYLVALMARYIQFIHVLLALSVPIMGVTLIVTYLTRCYRRGL